MAAGKIEKVDKQIANMDYNVKTLYIKILTRNKFNSEVYRLPLSLYKCYEVNVICRCRG